MKSVGLRELKNRLSAYVRELRSGETVLVTDRGEVVAELVPPGHSSLSPDVPSALLAWARSGQVTLGAPNQAELYPKLSPLLPEGRAQQLQDDVNSISRILFFKEGSNAANGPQRKHICLRYYQHGIRQVR